MPSRPNRLRSTRTSARTNQVAYNLLEERTVLATFVGLDVASGNVDVRLSTNADQAIFDVNGSGNVTLNGSDDLDNSIAGTQSLALADLRNITVVNSHNGVDGLLFRQQTTFNGDFSNANGADLQSISVSGQKFVTFNGTYELAGDLAININSGDVGGLVSDGTTGTVIVNGATNLTLVDNSFAFDNGTSDLVGSVSASSNQDISLSDINGVSLSNISTGGDLTVTAVGSLSDVAGSTIEVGGDGDLSAASILLGDDAGDTVNFRRIMATSAGAVEINEDSSVILLDVTADSLTVRSTGGIFDGRTTEISVANTARFEAVGFLRIGENGTDTFNAGSLSFTSTGHAHIWENSGTSLTGTNSAVSVNLFSEGDIVDGDTSTLNATGIVGLQSGGDIVLGDTGTDAFNAESLYFFANGDFDVDENSDMHIIGTRNQANRMIVSASGTITDDANASISVNLLADFTATSVSIGEQATDSFNAGSITFDTSSQFTLAEDSDTNIVGFNTANGLNVSSTGNITNVFTSGGGSGTTLVVATTAVFSGVDITIGDQNDDAFNFGSLTFNATGDASIAEDSDTVITGTSTAGALILDSTGFISDATSAQTTVTGRATLVAGSTINLGDTGTDLFNAGQLELTTTSSVAITEDSASHFAGTTRVGSLTLASAGNVTDAPTADVGVTGNFNVSGALINLGTEATDNLTMASLTFDSTANTNIVTNADVVLTGNSSSDNLLLLESSGNITDDTLARTEIANGAFFTGVDVIIGELATDCFDILNGDASDVSVTATGTENVQLGGC